MSGWILSIVGIVFMGIVIDIISPHGKTNKFIKGIFSIFMLFTFLSPIKSIINKFSNATFNENEIELDNNFLSNINIAKNESNQIIIQNRLNAIGVEGVIVTICSNVYKFDYQIEKIYVDTSNIVLSENISHINKYEVITNTILELINIEKGKHYF